METWAIILLVVFIVLIIGLAVLYKVRTKGGGDLVNEQYNILVNKYGSPNIEDRRKGGVVIWYKDKLRNTPFHKIELVDEAIDHCVPFPHKDFLYHYIQFDIPNVNNGQRILDVMKISGSISYDPLKKELRARCGSEEANVATLWLATEVALGKQSIENVHNNNIYPNTIKSISNPNNVSVLKKLLTQNIKSRGSNNTPTNYFKLAFPNGCEGGKEKEMSGGKEKEMSGGKEKEMSGGKEKEMSGGKEKEMSGGKEKEMSGGKEKEMSGGGILSSIKWPPI